MTKKAKEVWTLSELEPADIIIANEGISKVLAMGEVIDPAYVWRPDRQEYKHTISVRWDTSFEQVIPPQPRWAFTTVDLVSAVLYQQIISIRKPRGSAKDIPVDQQFARLENALERKGQAILYGPPGTGKTYQGQRISPCAHRQPPQVG